MAQTIHEPIEAVEAQKGERRRKRRPSMRMDMWTAVSLVLLALFALFLVYPLFNVLRESIVNGEGELTFEYFYKFFANSYYFQTIKNSFVLSITVTIVSLILGVPFSYFYTFYRLRGSKVLFIGAVLSVMSAPFIGAYAWILLLGRNGVFSQLFGGAFGITLPSIYGFGGLVLVLSLKLFPLVSIYMNAAFRSIDSSLIEAATLMGSTGVKRIWQVIIRLTIPTLLAASLLVFMRTFADFGTPLLIGQNYRTFTVEIYNQYLGETGQNHNFAAAIGIIGVLVTTVVFLIQKYVAGKFNFQLKSSRPIARKRPGGIGGVLIYAYQYGLIALALLPQFYIVYLSFRNNAQSRFLPGYTLDSYRLAMNRLLERSIYNTLLMGTLALAIIILIAMLIAYLVVRRPSWLNNLIDTLSMIPYIMPGAVIGIALVISFNQGPLALTGTMAILIIAVVIRRMPYTIRSATASLMHQPLSMEEAARSLGASKFKSFWKVTVPLMGSGIASGAILSFVTIVTEMSSAIILYNNQTITLTMSAYVAITRGNYGLACAFSSILTLITALILILYLAITKEENVKL
ncbi:iron ABC transporter permease [Schaalia sp. ZJ1691]|uniref:ABC transporter permease n=1 Tax=Schaalia sp. ZJ1691 TaxID=2709404 RepID=UPI00197F6A77|nr:iron ABC transporter permease [Schaalia sp. ZJ1691]